jgi:hypothetical protein
MLDVSCVAFADDAWIGPAKGLEGVGENDTEPPTCINFFPKQGATGVNAAANIFFDVMDDVSFVDTNSIVLKVNGQAVPATLKGLPASIRVTYDPPANLAPGVVNVAVDAKDKAGNAMTAVAYSFTVAGASGIVGSKAMDRSGLELESTRSSAGSIEFVVGLPSNGSYGLRVINAMGKTLWEYNGAAGHRLIWDAPSVAAPCMAVLKQGNRQIVQKLLVAR